MHSIWFWRLWYWHLFIVLYCNVFVFCVCVCVMCFFWQVSCPTVVWQNLWTYEMICVYVCMYVVFGSWTVSVIRWRLNGRDKDLVCLWGLPTAMMYRWLRSWQAGGLWWNWGGCNWCWVLLQDVWMSSGVPSPRGFVAEQSVSCLPSWCLLAEILPWCITDNLLLPNEWMLVRMASFYSGCLCPAWSAIGRFDRAVGVASWMESRVPGFTEFNDTG